MSETILELDGVYAGYGTSTVLHDVSLHLDRGEAVGLLGRNGAGKSTAMKSVMRLADVRRGTIRVKGVDVKQLPTHGRAALGVGYVPEDRRIFPNLTVWENLDVGRGTAKGPTGKWDMAACIALFPVLGDRLKQLGGSLSGGEQQMLAIARALMSNPDILLLDEPSEGLAPSIVDRLQDAVSELTAMKFSILLAEQNLGFVRDQVQRVVVLESGEVKYEGAIEGLEQDEQLRDRLLGVHHG